MQRKLFLDLADLQQPLILLAFLKIASWPPIAVCPKLRHDILANLCEYIFEHLAVLAHFGRKNNKTMAGQGIFDTDVQFGNSGSILEQKLHSKQSFQKLGCGMDT